MNSHLQSLAGILLAVAVVAAPGCGGSSKTLSNAYGPTGSASSGGQAGVAPAPTAITPPFNHVFILMEENHSYSSVIGNSSMPYLNSLASHYGLATQYYANAHPSIGNYFMVTTGKTVTNNDSFSGTVSGDNVVAHLLTAGKTWKSYAEGLPYTGYTGGNTGSYLKRHNPFAYLSNVVKSSVQKLNLVPFTNFKTDLANGRLPNYSFIVPNSCNDAHNCSLATADSWLKKNIVPLVANSTFQQSGILFIIFDESYTSDQSHGGGHVAFVSVSGKGPKGYRSGTFFQHQSALKATLQALGVTTFPGAASTAPNMTAFF